MRSWRAARIPSFWHRMRLRQRVIAVTALTCPLMLGLGLLAPAVQAQSVPLLPGGGQFVSVPIFKALDTRDGTGVVPAQPLAAGATVTVAVTGVGGIPTGADSVVMNINAIGPTQSGYLDVYNFDSGDPGVASVGLLPGENSNQTDTVPLSSDGEVSFTNHSSGTVDVAVAVTGYYSGAGTTATGSTYKGVPWAEIVDTTSGLGTTASPIPAGGSRTVQIGGQGGISAGTSVAVLQVNGMNATQDGYLTMYATGSSDPGVAALSYQAYRPIDRNLFYVPLSSSGQVTITNHGSASVDVTLYSRGYFLPPSSASPGDQYWSFDPDMLYGTTTAGASIGAGATVTLQVGGDGTVPATGVAEVAEDVVLTSPSAGGQLQIGSGNGPGHGVINFAAGSGTSVGYDDSVLTELSPDGQETITNTSSASVTVQVAAVGYYQDAIEPAAPVSVNAALSGTSATVTWAAPPSDGGSPITGYTVTASPDTATVTVDGGTYQATLSGLANAATDTFAVTATNATGTSGAGTFTASAATTVSGTVLAPSGSPVAGASVGIFTADAPDDTITQWTPDQLGTTTTDSSGNWSFTVPSYSALSADAQQEASNNGGTLNIEAEAYGQAVVNGTSYIENDSAAEQVWVGTGTGGTPAAGVTPQPQQMTLVPEGPDNSALDTTTAETQTWAYQNSATTDASGEVVDDTVSDSPPPTDSFGYQSIGPDNNYDPYVASDGTDLTNVPVTASPLSVYCTIDWTKVLNTWWQWTKVGATHSGWNNHGDFWYGHGGSTSIGEEISADGDHFNLGGHITWTHGSDSKWDWGKIGTNNSRYAYLAFNYEKLKVKHGCYNANTGVEYEVWYRWKRRVKSLHQFSNSVNYAYGSKNLYSQADGPDNLKKIEAKHPHYVFNMARGSTFAYSWSKTQDFGTAVEIGGIGVDAETSLDNVTEQEIEQGDGTRYLHRIWSWHGNPESCNCRLQVIQSR